VTCADTVESVDIVHSFTMRDSSFYCHNDAYIQLLKLYMFL